VNEKLIRARLDNIVGLHLFYGNVPFTLEHYRIDTQLERVYMYNLDTAKEIDRPFNGIESFVLELQPAPTNANGQRLKPVEKTNTEIKNPKMETPTFAPVAKPDEAPKTFSDLRSLLLNNIYLLQTGKINVSQAKEIANQAQTIINITKIEIEYQKTITRYKS